MEQRIMDGAIDGGAAGGTGVARGKEAAQR